MVEPLSISVITGVVSVLLVSVCVPVRVATVLSIAMVIALSATVVPIPVPPVNVRVSPVEKVSAVPESLDDTS